MPTKKYSEMVSLVKDRSTPVGVALAIVSRLSPQDLQAVAADRNIPEAIRKAAQRFLVRLDRSASDTTCRDPRPLGSYDA